MHREQRQKTIELLQARHIDCALFAHPESVTWLTGFSPAVQSGWAYFASSPPLVLYATGEFTLIAVDGHPNNPAAYADDGLTVRTYEGYTIDHAIRSHDALSELLADMLGDLAVRKHVGVELRTTPQTVNSIVSAQAEDIAAIDDALLPLRAIKTEEELAKMRHNFALSGAGHAAALAIVQPGLREIDVWAGVTAAIFNAAGQPVLIGNDCVTSAREANIGGWPKDQLINQGDNITLDIGVFSQGYWSDSCRAYYTHELTPQQHALHRHVEEALDYAISLIKPGAVAKEIDQKVRAMIEKAGHGVYPHHTGHGIGVAAHEAPRIVPYNDEILQPGMVIMLEPGIYIPGQISIRLEDAVLVTDDGAEVLTDYDRSGWLGRTV